MGRMEGKKGLVFGIANDRSIAAAIAAACHTEGAKMAFTHLPDADPDRPKAANRLKQVVKNWDPAFLAPCDARNDEQLDSVFAQAKEAFGTLDFVIHSMAYAPIEDIKRPVHQVSRDGFSMSMEISAYSLIALASRAKELMPDGGSILAMTYLGGEKVIPGYNLMGVCKATLESTLEYVAHEFGPAKIRVNALSAGPVRTLAASAVGDFHQMQKLYETFSPLRRNISADEVGQAGAFLLSDAASGITGENLHVDAGYHIMGAPPEDTGQSEK